MSHQVFQKQVLSPTGVEHCIKANLVDNDTINLVLSKNNTLQVYKIKYERIEKYEIVIDSQQEIINSIMSTINEENDSGQQQSNQQSSQTAATQSTQPSQQQQQIKKIEIKPSLELLIELKLFGTIESIASVRYPEETKDSLILTFRDAKISILDYNIDIMDFEIRSLHFYENDEFKNGRIHFKHPPFLKVDTQQRCATMLLYDRNIAVLPFKQFSSILDDEDEEEKDEDDLNGINDQDYIEEFEDEDDADNQNNSNNNSSNNNSNNNRSNNNSSNNNSGSKSTSNNKNDANDQDDDEFDFIFSKSSNDNSSSGINGNTNINIKKKRKEQKQLKSFIIDLKSIDIENVKDFCFLYGYYEPTLLFLHEPSQTWTSRIAVKRLTSQLTAISINFSTKTASIIWHTSNMPYNCDQLVSVPEPLSGALVITPNIMFHVNQTSKYGLAVNEYANTDIGDKFEFPLDTNLNLVFTLDRSNFVFLESDKFIGSLKGGELLIFHLISDGRTVQRIHVSKAGGSVLTTCMCVLSDNLLFLGSRLGDSLLLQYTEKSITDESLEHENFSNPYKKQKTSEVFDIFDEEQLEQQEQEDLLDQQNQKEQLDEEDELFKEKKNQLKSYQLGICDQIINIGPVGDMVIGQSLNPNYDINTPPSDPSYLPRFLELVSCSGYGKNGSISVLHNSVKPEFIGAFDSDGSLNNFWTIYNKQYKFNNHNHNSSVKDNNNSSSQQKDSTASTASTTTTTSIGKKRTISDILKEEQDQLQQQQQLQQQLELEQESGQIENYHDYLYISMNSGITRIFETTGDLTQKGELNYSVLDMGNLFNRERIVLVNENSIKLLSGYNSIVQDIKLSKSIKSTFIQDPFVLVHYSDNSIQLFNCDYKSLKLKEFKLNLNTSDSGDILTTSLFFDKNQFFLNLNNSKFNEYQQLQQQQQQQQQPDKVVEVENQQINKVNSKKEKKKSSSKLEDQDSNNLSFLDSSSSEEEEDNSGSSSSEEDDMDKLLNSKEKEDEIMKEKENQQHQQQLQQEERNNNHEVNLVENNIYLSYYTSKGIFEIYRLSSLESIFKSSNILIEPEILGIPTSTYDNQVNFLEKVLSPPSSSSTSQSLKSSSNKIILQIQKQREQREREQRERFEQQLLQNENLEIVEISLEILNNSQPYLILKNRIGDLIIYKSFKKQNGDLRFKKFNHNIILRDNNSNNNNNNNSSSKYNSSNKSNSNSTTLKSIKYNKKSIINIKLNNNKNGLFVGGKKPLWIFNHDKGYIRLHLMDFDGAIETFKPFYNVNCLNGFIYYTEETQYIKIGNLNGLMNYENEYAIRRVPIKQTAHKIAYHNELKCYVVVVSFPQVTQELEEHSKKPILTDDKFQIKIIDPTMDWSWRFIDSFSLQDRETVLAMKIVSLKFKESDDTIKSKPFLVIGTAFTFGEDTQCKGRVLVFEIVSHKTQFDSESTKRFNLLYEKEQKGPVTALSSVSGLLLMTIGPKLTVNQFLTGQLITLSFYDAQIYICSICTIKTYIVIGDMYKSVYFLQWNGKQLVALSKDYQSLNIFSTEFIVNQHTLSILVSDLDKNILLFSFDPADPTSRQGQMLLCKADFHIGSNIEKFVRTPMKFNINNSASSNGNGNSNGINIQVKDQLVFFGTLDGGVNVLRPLDERMYQLFYHLQSKLYYLPQSAGLNPKQYRAFKSFSQNFHFSPSTIHQLPKYILDGDLLSKFLNLNQKERRLLASSVGSSIDEIIFALKQVFDSWSLF